MLDLGAYLLAVAELAAIAAALTWGAVRTRAALLPSYEGAPARLAEAVLGLSTLLVVCELLGLVGLFKELPLLLTCVAVGLLQGFYVKPLAARLLPRVAGREDPPARRLAATSGGSPPDRTRGPAPRRPAAFGGHWLQLGIAIAATAIVFDHWLIPTIASMKEGMYGFDSQWYHLPFSARFAETGQLWDFHYTTPVLLSWFYPANSELLHAAGMVVTGRDVLSPLMNLGWLFVALLAAWCLGRPWGVGGFAVLGAFLVLDAGVLADQGGDARNDAMALALILAAAALLAQRPAALASSALAAGMALGTRLTSLGPVAALTVGVIAVARSGRRLKTAAVWIAGLLVTGGLWFARNLVEVGSPLPQVMSLGPLDLPGPDQALGGRPSFSVAHYITDFAVWGDWFVPALRDAFGLVWPLALALAVIGAVLALTRGPTRMVRMLGAVAILTALVYVVTPVTASGPEGQPIGFGPNLRYLTPGLALALALLPVALTGFSARVRIMAAIASGLAALPLVFDVDRWHEGVPATGAVAAVLAAALLAAVLVAVALLRDGEREVRVPAVAVGFGVAALAALALVGGFFAQRFYFDHRYQESGFLANPGLEEVFAWASDISGARIATTTTRQFPLYGDDLSNHVQHIGIEKPEGGFVAATRCREWLEAVNAGDYDYVVIAPDRIEPGVAAFPDAVRWVAGAPNTELVSDEHHAWIYEVAGPLDISSCDDDPMRIRGRISGL